MTMHVLVTSRYAKSDLDVGPAASAQYSVNSSYITNLFCFTKSVNHRRASCVMLSKTGSVDSTKHQNIVPQWRNMTRSVILHVQAWFTSACYCSQQASRHACASKPRRKSRKLLSIRKQYRTV